jgi:hypothetical protein
VFITHNKRRLEQRLAAMLHKSSSSQNREDDGDRDSNRANNSITGGITGDISSSISSSIRNSISSSSSDGPYIASTNDGKPPPGHVAVLDTGLQLYFAPSAKLSELLRNDEDMEVGGTVTDATVARISEAFTVPNLTENVSRARRYIERRHIL